MKKRKREEDTQAQRTEPVLAAVREQRDQFSGRLECTSPPGLPGKGEAAGQLERMERKGRQQASVIPQCLRLA